jgi:hypothetical protein
MEGGTNDSGSFLVKIVAFENTPTCVGNGVSYAGC